MDICKLAKGIRKFAVGFCSGASSELHGEILCQYLLYCGMGSQKLHDHWSKPTIYKLKRHFNGYFRSLTVRNIRFCKVLGFLFFNFLHFQCTQCFLSTLWNFCLFLCKKYWMRWMDWPYLFNRVFSNTLRVLLPAPIKSELITWPIYFLAMSRYAWHAK